jgi:hypothetical protein
VADWATVAELGTAGGTLVLAVATFASVRSANRSARSADRAARAAELSLLEGLRPLLANSRLQDPDQKTMFVEGHRLIVGGGRAALEVTRDVVYLAVSIRNVGSGLAVLHGWHLLPGMRTERGHPPIEEFVTQLRDIYVAPGELDVWNAAFRDPDAEEFGKVAAAVSAGEPMTLNLLYGDFEGGQRVISQLGLRKQGDNWLATVGRHYNVDRPDPR